MPTSASRLSRRTLVAACAIALVVVVAGTVGLVLHGRHAGERRGPSTPTSGAAHTVWAQIILDEELFPRGEYWSYQDNQLNWKKLASHDVGVKVAWGLKKGEHGNRVTPAKLHERYGEGSPESGMGVGKDSLGIPPSRQYDVYGPLAFGRASRVATEYDTVQVEAWLGRDGFLKTAKQALSGGQ